MPNDEQSRNEGNATTTTQSSRASDCDAQAWRSLANEFLSMAERFAGQAIRLGYRKSPSGGPADFDLYYVQPSESEPWRDSYDEHVSWRNPVAASGFRNLCAKGLIQAGRRPSDPVWQDWAEFIFDALPYHQEDAELTARSQDKRNEQRLSYLRGVQLNFIDESVLACQQKEFVALTGAVPKQPKLYARGLKSLRLKHGLSQEGFAERIGYKNREKISRWESCKKQYPISEDAVRRICREFRCGPEDVLGTETDF